MADLFAHTQTQEFGGVVVEMWRRAHNDAPCEELLFARPEKALASLEPTNFSDYIAFHYLFVSRRATKEPRWQKKFAMAYDLRTLPTPRDITMFVAQIAGVIDLHNRCGEYYKEVLFASCIIVKDESSAEFTKSVFSVLGGMPERPVHIIVGNQTAKTDCLVADVILALKERR